MSAVGRSGKGRPMVVRPYTMTGGRTQSRSSIAIESMVSVNETNSALAADLYPELYSVMELAAEPISVAEISAHLQLPLQVAKILVGDLLYDHHLQLHSAPTATFQQQRPDLQLLDRVLDGLQRL